MKTIRKALSPICMLLVLFLSACAAPAATQAPAVAPTVEPATSEPAATQALPTEQAPTLVPTAAPTEAATLPHELPSSSAAITAEVLKNFTFTGPTYGKTYQLVSGKYEGGTASDYVRVTLLDQIAFGDLNGDGKPDAAVFLGENNGGTGTFISLITVLDENGKPMQNASAMIDDRARINSVKIQDGKIIVDAIIHSFQDPMCCASFPVLQTYQLTKGGLAQVRMESTTPDNMQRAIDITSPQDGDAVSSSVQLQGSVTIAPFENNLVYRIFDGQGNKLSEGPVTVNSANPGDPGTFDSAIDISSIPAGQLVRIGLFDVSAADGSTLAMDSVEVMTK